MSAQTTAVVPSGFGYVAVPSDLGPDDAEAALREWTHHLAGVAEREGYAFAGIFADVRGQTETGLYRLLEVLRAGEGVAVLTPDLDHLRHAGCLTGADLRTAALLACPPGTRRTVVRCGSAAVRVRRPVSAQGLLVPADLRRRVEVREVPLTASALSDLIGGGLLDETMHAAYDGHGYVMYLDEQRVEQGLPVNDRAAVLSARLGVVGRAWMQGLLGDVLVLGADEDGEDQDIPRVVLDLARVAGLLPTLAPRFLASSVVEPRT